MSKDKAVVAICLIAFFFAFLVVPVSADYTTFHADNARTGTVTNAGESPLMWNYLLDEKSPNAISMDSVGKTVGRVKWNAYYLDFTSVNTSPILINGMVYFGTSPYVTNPDTTKRTDTSYKSPGIYCYDIANPISKKPALKWSYSIPSGVSGGLTYSNGYIYAGGIDGKLYCINANDGTQKWVTSERIDTTEGTGLSSTPLILNNYVYVTAQNPAVLYGFDTGNGSEKIKIELKQSVAHLSSPSVNTEETLLFTSGNNGVIAINTTTNNEEWNYSVGKPAGTPVYYEESIYFTTETDLYSISSTGTLKWNVSHVGNATTPVVTDKLVIVNGQDGLSAYAVSNGTKMWGDPVVADAVVSPNSPVADLKHDIVYYTQNHYGGKAGYVHAVSLNDGSSLGNHTMSKSFSPLLDGTDGEKYLNVGYATPIYYSSPAIADDILVVGTSSILPEKVITDIQNLSPTVTKIPSKFVDVSEVGEKWAVESMNGDSLWFFGAHSNMRFSYDYQTETKNQLTLYYGIPFNASVGNSLQKIDTATVLGVLDTASTYKVGSMTNTYYTYTLSESGEKIIINSINGNSGPWYVWKNDQSLGHEISTTERVEISDILKFASGSDLTTARYTYTVKVDDIKYPTVTISTSPGSPGLTTRNVLTTSSATSYANVYDAKGNLISGASVVWTKGGTVDISQSQGSSSTWKITGNNSPSITATYTLDTKSFQNTLSFNVYSESDALTLIPKNSAVESTSTFFTYKGNYARTGVANGDGPTSPDLLWDEEFDDLEFPTLVDGHPVVANGNVYFTTWGGGMSDGKTVNGVYSYNATTGKRNWYSPSITSRSGLTVQDGKIYGGNGGKLVCIDEETGSDIWATDDISYASYVGLTSIPLIYNNTVYISTVHKSGSKVIESLYGFSLGEKETDSKKPKEIFRLDAGRGTGMYSAPAMSVAGTNYPAVVYASGDGGVFAVDTTTNQKIWSFDAGARGQGRDSLTDTTDYGGNGMYVSGPVYKNGCVYFTVSHSNQYSGEYGSGLYCLYAVTGDLKWHAPITIGSANTPVVTDDKILFTNNGLYAYDLNGTQLWFCETGDTVRAAATVAGNLAYFGSYAAGTLYAVDITQGTIAWQYKVPPIAVGSIWYSLIEATPAVSDGILYIGSENGHFYAFRVNDNEPFEIITPPVITAGVEAVFTTNTSRNYYWSFDDKTSTSSTGTSVAKVWKEPGTHTVTAYIGNNKQTLTVTVLKAPEPYKAPQTNTTTLSAESGISLPDNNSLTIRFGNDLSAESSADKITLKIDKYDAATEDSNNISISDITIQPPNTDKTIFRMNVSAVTGLKEGVKQNDLGRYVAIIIKLYIGETDINKVRFWRYTDPNAAPERLQLETTAKNEGDGWAIYTVLTRGFSDIVATVEDANNDLVFVPATTPPSGGSTGGTGGGGSGSASLNSLSFTNVNPGTGDFEYTTTDGTTYTVSGMTAFGVLNAAGLTLETKTWPGGIYVNAINGLAQDANLNGWMYQVNGYAPMVMSNNYKVTYGDKVVWYYSDNQMSTDPAKSKKYYAFTVSTAVSATGGGASGQTIGQTAKPGTTTTVLPAETKQIAVTIPDGISVEKLAVGQKITIDTAVTKLTGTVNVNSRSIVIIQPGIQITIPLADVVYNGDVATATIRGMTAEIVPVPVTVPKGGYSL